MTTEKLKTIARPYALAAFEYGLEQQDLPGWQVFLRAASQVAEDKSVLKVLDSPKTTTEDQAGLFCAVLDKLLDEKKKNFIHLLAEYGRLTVFPAITALFNSYYEEHQKIVEVEMATAIPLSDAYQAKFVAALTERLKRKVSLHCTVDEALLGGAMVRAGDLVIDGSVRGKLNRLLESLKV